jgi:hypothetical protein
VITCLLLASRPPYPRITFADYITNIFFTKPPVFCYNRRVLNHGVKIKGFTAGFAKAVSQNAKAVLRAKTGRDK